VCQWRAAGLRQDGRVDVNEMLLPGVGVRYDFTTRDGEHVGVVARRGGDFELAIYDRRDPDRVRHTVSLDEDAAEALVQILGATRITQRLADLSREIPGLESARIEVLPGSPYADRPLGDTRARTRTGASIVAVVSGDAIATSPAPDHVLRSGDMLVAIGTADGLAELGSIVERG
jgi:TrkA domain protein